MPSRGSLTVMRTKRGLVLFWTALFVLSMALQYAAAMAPQSALAISGAIYSSNFDGSITNANHYPTKPDVYLTGGPCQGGSHLDPGDYYFEVSIPNTATLLSTDAIGNRKFTVGANGFISGTSGTHDTHAVACSGITGVTLQLIPFDDTTNSGGEYKLTVATAASVEKCDGFNAELVQSICGEADQKSDNFKVLGPGSLKITKAVDGGDFSGSFDVQVDCGNAGSFEDTIDFPDPGFVTITGIDAGAECNVTETLPDAPDNFSWGEPSFAGNPATIVSGDTVTVDITNHLNALPPETGSLLVVKDIPNVPDDFTGSFDVSVKCEGIDAIERTIDFPDPGAVTIDDLPAGVQCAVLETSRSDPPDGFQWGGPLFAGTATITADETTDITVTNLLAGQNANPVLGVSKSNDAPLVNDLPTANEGDTVTYTLQYTVTDGPIAGGVIIDTPPAGVTYVPGSATGDAQFTFVGDDAGGLTWKATSVATNGTVTYKVTIDAGAAALDQPLTNQVCIGVDTGDENSDFPEACDTSDVFVGPPPKGETSVPKTAPPSDFADSTDSNVSGGGMLLVLLGLVGVGLALVFVAPTPAAVRKRR